MRPEPDSIRADTSQLGNSRPSLGPSVGILKRIRCPSGSAKYIDQVKSPDTDIELRGTRVGRIDSFRFFETLDWISILDSVIGAEQEGYDAVAIGNILDPALREARSMVDIPVLGLGETSMLTSVGDLQGPVSRTSSWELALH